ncbi:uncharacterized protein LOC143859655 [Tasmannia lanceolata]|uniref:uncharacterized protein LOC143859655 n=1 Tax=Tasmannia lanceolata TaxID=3420 RepID=UPI004063BDAC
MSSSLLEIILNSNEDAPAQSKYPIILNPDEIFRQLKPENENTDEAFSIQRVSGWQISEIDSEIIESGNRFNKKLKRKMKNPKSFSREEFLTLLNSFLQKKKDEITVGSEDLDYTSQLIKKRGFLISRDLALLISEACVSLDLWDLLETLILQKHLSRCSSHSNNLVENLIEEKKVHLICLYIKQVSDLTPSHFKSILKFFLSENGSDPNMMTVRKEWENQALLSIEKATQKYLPEKKLQPARCGSLLLSMAHDGFSAPELCLHYLFGSSNIDGLALSSAIGGLDGLEMMKLIRYFLKWLQKYERFPQASHCKAEQWEALGLELCKWVPSLESIIMCVGLVLDENFSFLTLYSEFHHELRLIEEIVRRMVPAFGFCCSVANLVENLKLEAIGSR